MEVYNTNVFVHGWRLFSRNKPCMKVFYSLKKEHRVAARNGQFGVFCALPCLALDCLTKLGCDLWEMYVSFLCFHVNFRQQTFTSRPSIFHTTLLFAKRNPTQSLFIYMCVCIYKKNKKYIYLLFPPSRNNGHIWLFFPKHNRVYLTQTWTWFKKKEVII